jgi:apolipoprotein N-acyltransferase
MKKGKILTFGLGFLVFYLLGAYVFPLFLEYFLTIPVLDNLVGAVFSIQAAQLILSLSILVVLHELGNVIPVKIFKTRKKLFFWWLRLQIVINIAYFHGLLLGFSWPEIGFSPLIFVAFIPLLLIEKYISDSGPNTSWSLFGFSFLTFFSSRSYTSWKVFGYFFITFLSFNITTTYWVWHASAGGSITAFIINSLLMSLPFVLFHKVKRILGNKRGYFALIFFWISMEYLHLNWELAWPWLTLGNVFATIPEIVQWYEFTGVLGGSVWVLVINILLFIWWDSERIKKKLILPFTIILIPIIISLSLKTDFDEEKTIEVVIVQPNIDSYNESEFNIDTFISLSESKITESTELLLAPETVLQGRLDETDPNFRFHFYLDTSVRRYQGDIDKLLKLQERYPKLNILIGATTIKNNDVYNSAVFISNNKEIFIHHKTELVPGAEAIPYPSIFNRFKDFLSIKLDGAAGNYGRGKDITMFSIDKVDILPLICYESVFGDVITGKKANIIAIITNDGWWKNTAGYKQHFQYARLRAIEQRKSIVRSANTGISGLIHPNGEVIDQTNWDEDVAINVKVPLNDKVTFYNRFGDYIGRISSFVAVLLLLSSFVKKRIKKIPS